MSNENIFNLDLRFLKDIKEQKEKLTSTNLSAYEYKMNKLRESLEDKQIDAVRLFEIESEIGKINLEFSSLLYNNIHSKKYFIKAHLFNDFGY